MAQCDKSRILSTCLVPRQCCTSAQPSLSWSASRGTQRGHGFGLGDAAARHANIDSLEPHARIASCRQQVIFNADIAVAFFEGRSVLGVPLGTSVSSTPCRLHGVQRQQLLHWWYVAPLGWQTRHILEAFAGFADQAGIRTIPPQQWISTGSQMRSSTTLLRRPSTSALDGGKKIRKKEDVVQMSGEA